MVAVVRPLRQRAAGKESGAESPVAGWDRIAFDTLFRAHYGELCTYVQRMLHDRAAAEEVVQNVFLKICERGLPGRAGTVSRAYLYAAARNDVIDNARALRRVERHVAAVQRADMEVAPDAASETEYRELVALVRCALATLPRRPREVFLLSRRDGLDYVGIARALGLSVKTVESHMRRALSALRTALGGRSGTAIVLVAAACARVWSRTG
jgi:RNA polymerase sigma-70 factor (ECF subfamily)